jgi:hypothetical protein
VDTSERQLDAVTQERAVGICRLATKLCNVRKGEGSGISPAGDVFILDNDGVRPA